MGDSSTDFNGALNYCENNGDTLAIIKNAEDQSRAAAACAGYSCWIGLLEEGGTWAWGWIDGENLSYSNWQAGYPRNHDGTCSAHAGSAWEDDPACEYPACTQGVDHYGCTPDGYCRAAVADQACVGKPDWYDMGDGWTCHRDGDRDRDCPSQYSSTDNNHQGNDEKHAIMNCCSEYADYGSDGKWYNAPESHYGPRALCMGEDYHSGREAHRKEGDKNESNDILVGLVIISILLGIALITAVACVYKAKNNFRPDTVVAGYRATPQPIRNDFSPHSVANSYPSTAFVATAHPAGVQMATFATEQVVTSTESSSTQNKFCGNCGVSLNAGNKFCGNCGSRID